MCHNLTLKKSDKLLNRDDFSEVFKHKRVFNTQKNIRIFYYIENQRKPKFGLIVSKKIAKKAVARNYMKRLLREWYRNNKCVLPNGAYIFMVKNKFSHENFQELNHELDHFKQYIKKKFL